MRSANLKILARLIPELYSTRSNYHNDYLLYDYNAPSGLFSIIMLSRRMMDVAFSLQNAVCIKILN